MKTPPPFWSRPKNRARAAKRPERRRERTARCGRKPEIPVPLRAALTVPARNEVERFQDFALAGVSAATARSMQINRDRASSCASQPPAGISVRRFGARDRRGGRNGAFDCDGQTGEVTVLRVIDVVTRLASAIRIAGGSGEQAPPAFGEPPEGKKLPWKEREQPLHQPQQPEINNTEPNHQNHTRKQPEQLPPQPNHTISERRVTNHHPLPIPLPPEPIQPTLHQPLQPANPIPTMPNHHLHIIPFYSLNAGDSAKGVKVEIFRATRKNSRSLICLLARKILP